jgi:hypothetical protein
LAVTVDEIIAMTEAGVSDDVIVALLEATDSAFYLSPDDIMALEEAGVDDDIIMAMIGSTEYREGKADEDVYLKLDEDEFRRLFLEDDNPEDTYYGSQGYERQPEYYYSSGSYYGQGYVSHQDYSRPGYSSGLTRNTYYYSHPRGYSYGRKYYRPKHYYDYSYPGYFFYDGVTYYPERYHYSPYPKYYTVHYPRYHYRQHYPYSRYRVYKYPRDDWYFSLGFSF